MGGWSEEEYLIEHDKYVSNTCSNDHDDLLGSSNNKDVCHEHLRMMEPQKYLRESCYHHIECTAATFLAAFMLRRPPKQCCLRYHNSQKARKVI